MKIKVQIDVVVPPDEGCQYEKSNTLFTQFIDLSSAVANDAVLDIIEAVQKIARENGSPSLS